MASVDGILIESGCNCCCKEKDSKLIQMRRFFVFMTCAGTIACFITIILTLCTMYIYIQQVGKLECHVHRQTGNNTNIGDSKSVPTGNNSSESAASKVNRRIARRAAENERRHKNKCKKGKKQIKCNPESPMAETLRQVENITSLKDNDISRKADHYVANFTDTLFTAFNYRKSDLSDNCLDIPEWRGTLCRNRIFTSPAAQVTLNIFKRAGWMEKFKVSGDVFHKMDNGTFVAKRTGLHLLYAQLLFHDLQPMQVFKVVHRRNGKDLNSLKCMDGSDYIDSALKNVDNFRHKTCTIMGVLLLDADDTIEVVMSTQTRIDLTENATYFGVVFLS